MQVKNGYTGEACDAEDYVLGVGPGWQPIVRKLFADMFDAGWNGEVCQVKEKFGGLRVYIGSAPDSVLDLIGDAEDVCYRTCESCGAEGVPRQGGWIKTLCDKCHAKTRE